VLLAELFLQELNPVFVARSTGDVGYDFLIGVVNSKGGINNIAVEVKATESLTRKEYPISKKNYKRLAYSNIQVLFLVVDVKENRLYYAWLTPDVPTANGGSSSVRTVRVELTELDDKSQEELRHRLAT